MHAAHPTPPAAAPPLSLWGICALVAGAAAALNLAYEVAACTPLIVVFFACVCGLARVRCTTHALRAGWVLGLLIYAPQLAFFWGIFGVAAFGLWLVLACWLALYLVLQRIAFVHLGAWGTACAAPVLWVALEYARSELYTLRFSWVNAGYLLPGLVTWVGVYGVGVVTMAFGAVGATAIAQHRRMLGAAVIVAGAAACVFIGPAGVSPGGHAAMATASPPQAGAAHHAASITVAGVQLEFPSQGTVVHALNALAAEHPDADVLVLSEYTFDGAVPAPVRAWCAANQRTLVAGGKAHTGVGEAFRNTAFVIGPDGRDAFSQAKSVPIQFFADGLPAAEQRIWESPWGKIGICVCYDLSYTRVTDELIRQGAQLIIVPTMDLEAWGARQHALHARVAPVRAAEYGVPVFRVCSSGISQAVDASGRVHARASFPGQGEMLAASFTLQPGGGAVPIDRALVWPSLAFAIGLAAWAAVRGLRPARPGRATDAGRVTRSPN